MHRLMGRGIAQRSAGSNSSSSREAAARERRFFPQRLGGKAALLLASIALLTFAFAPFNQFYLAWVGLVPWMIVLKHCRTTPRAFFWSWLGGVGFFTANMWWLVYVTGPGMAALMVVLGLYWGVAGAIIFATHLVGDRPGRGLVGVLGIPAIWVGMEWVRASFPFGGLEWLNIGDSQSPLLHLCQIADLTGIWGVSFWVVMVNACVATLFIRRCEIARVALAPVGAGLLMLIVAAYGFWRFSQQTTRPGPTVLVVQPNYPQSNSGDKGAGLSEILAFHVRTTRAALRQHPKVDLVVWSETMMPPLNKEAIEHVADAKGPTLPQIAVYEIQRIADEYHTCVLVGGMYWGKWVLRGGTWVSSENRNSTYLFEPGTGIGGQGRQTPSPALPRSGGGGISARLRYDKVHLVPFGEYLPFQKAFPPLYHFFLWLSPYKEDYFLVPGEEDRLTVFQLKDGTRFITPICFEDIVSALVRRMLDGGAAGKRADVIVNVTNDGWFKFNQMPQHLQAAIFRSIENRVPTARSVNTGISGFVDSLGQTHGLLVADTEGVSVATLQMDDRVTFYTRWGDIFAYVCAIVTGLAAVVAMGKRFWRISKQVELAT